eukprot:TRINITY_DN32512_c0_g1_i1.p1 TRINITY_DN32512_c0_g1~~TRINITY_DN32512_c0_g1_i1.p1  ORF type:complete len:283 (+),score=25.39 TRINITY_DN32512_c0_g1_i1:911-1759(+)
MPESKSSAEASGYPQRARDAASRGDVITALPSARSSAYKANAEASANVAARPSGGSLAVPSGRSLVDTTARRGGSMAVPGGRSLGLNANAGATSHGVSRGGFNVALPGGVALGCNSIAEPVHSLGLSPRNALPAQSTPASNRTIRPLQVASKAAPVGPVAANDSQTPSAAVAAATAAVAAAVAAVNQRGRRSSAYSPGPQRPSDVSEGSGAPRAVSPRAVSPRAVSPGTGNAFRWDDSAFNRSRPLPFASSVSSRDSGRMSPLSVSARLSGQFAPGAQLQVS